MAEKQWRANVGLKGISPAVGAVATDAVLTAYHAIIRRAGARKGDVVFVFGLGGLGFNALQILLAIGARCIVSDIRENVLKEAVRFGVPEGDVVPSGKSVQKWVEENGLVDKIDIVADFVGVEQTFEDAQFIGMLVTQLLTMVN
jgi:alcohol dehydrogenase, propanol-preferring